MKLRKMSKPQRGIVMLTATLMSILSLGVIWINLRFWYFVAFAFWVVVYLIDQLYEEKDF